MEDKGYHRTESAGAHERQVAREELRHPQARADATELAQINQERLFARVKALEDMLRSIHGAGGIKVSLPVIAFTGAPQETQVTTAVGGVQVQVTGVLNGVPASCTFYAAGDPTTL